MQNHDLVHPRLPASATSAPRDTLWQLHQPERLGETRNRGRAEGTKKKGWAEEEEEEALARGQLPAAGEKVEHWKVHEMSPAGPQQWVSGIFHHKG